METSERLAHFFLFLFFIVYLSQTSASKEDGGSGSSNFIPIRFPFRLENLQHNKHCGYPGFELSCNEKNETVLELPFSGKFLVRNINYTAQEMEIYDPDGCLPRRFFDFNLSNSPFKGKQYWNYTFFNCAKDYRDDSYTIINCLNEPNSTYNIGAISGYTVLWALDFLPLKLCNVTRTLLNIPWKAIGETMDDFIILTWDKPGCSECKSHGGDCGFNSNYTSLDDIGCLAPPNKGVLHHPTKGTWRKNMGIGVSIGFFVFLVATLTIIRTCTLTDKDEKEKQLKIEKFLESYKDLTPKRYSYADIKRMTNKFQRQLGEGGYGSVYEGKFSNGIPVAVKILNDSQSHGEDFINEVATIGRIHHKNVVRLLGFCADGFRRALIYEFMPKESLEKFIFSSSHKDKNPFFGWEKLQEISIGIARGIEYLHQGCEQRILHFDIKPHNILLDHKFNPKISDFGLAKLCSKADSIVSMTEARGTMGYIAPEVFSRNFGKVSYKSDVYSFGMLLLEMVGGRKNIEVLVDKVSQVYFPEWIYSRLEQGEELGIEVETEEDAKIARKLATTALWCIQWNPVDRPSMESVIQMLEGNSENLIMPPNPFVSSTFVTTSTTISGKPQQQQTELTIIQEERE